MDKKKTGFPSIDKPWLKYYDSDESALQINAKSVYDYFVQQKPPMNSVAIDFFGKKITYSQLLDQIEKTRIKFLSLGIKKGDVVTLCSPMVPEIYYIFFSLNQIGAVANLLDPRTNIEFIEKSIYDTNSRILIYIDQAYEKMRTIKANEKLPHVFYLPVSGSFPRALKMLYDIKNRNVFNELRIIKHYNWLDYKAETPASKGLNNDVTVDDLAAIVYTSGTTEIPKGALLSNKNIIALTVQSRISDFGWDRYDRFLEIMPPFIAYGLLCGIVIPLCIGMQVIVIPKFEQEKFADLIIKYKPNHIMGVPSMMEDLTKNKKLEKTDLSFLKTVIVGGDKISTTAEKGINKYLEDHNCPIKLIKGYGMTEMSSNAVFTKSKECNIDGSVGIPLMGNNVKIIDSDGNELKYDEEGEICLTGPTLIPGYFNNKTLTEQVFVLENNERWIHSGDIGYMNEDGILFIEGRIKRMIIRYDGFKVIPRLIEDAICMNSDVKGCAVVGTNDKLHGQGQLPLAWVELYDKAKKDSIKDTLMLLCRTNLPEYEQPVDIMFIDELPLTPIGKVDYKALEKM